MDTNPIIALFETQAQMLDVSDQQTNIDDAIVKLTTWLYLSQGVLSEDDMTLLVEVGGILYREGLERRLQQRRNDMGF
ncbi:hypothetical protein [Aquitalea magnusonii]|uniref:hypothetical protein n=1 Tax=Aquitalea magnusonii TaxID=332411 RepID=UPI000B5CA590|nr:hypothetical protein [Aquitalea magnusonii]